MNENEALRFLCFTSTFEKYFGWLMCISKFETCKGAFYQIRGEISIKENLHLVRMNWLTTLFDLYENQSLFILITKSVLKLEGIKN